MSWVDREAAKTYEPCDLCGKPKSGKRDGCGTSIDWQGCVLHGCDDKDLGETYDVLRDAQLWQRSVTGWASLTDEQRLAFLASLPCCRHCGSLNTRCQCWNDE